MLVCLGSLVPTGDRRRGAGANETLSEDVAACRRATGWRQLLGLQLSSYANSGVESG